MVLWMHCEGNIANKVPLKLTPRLDFSDVLNRGRVQIEKPWKHLQFSWLLFTLCLDARQPGTTFKRLNARQSEIFYKNQENNHDSKHRTLLSLFRNVKRLSWARWIPNWANSSTWAQSTKHLFEALRKISTRDCRSRPPNHYMPGSLKLFFTKINKKL